MTKFKKVLSIRLVSLILAVVFSIPATAYGMDLSNRSHLRPPLATSTDEGKTRLNKAEEWDGRAGGGFGLEGDGIIAAEDALIEEMLLNAASPDYYAVLQLGVPMLFQKIRDALDEQNEIEARVLLISLSGILNALSMVKPPELDEWRRIRNILSIAIDLQRQAKAKRAVLEAPDKIANRIMRELAREPLGNSTDIAEKLQISADAAYTALELLVKRKVLFREGGIYYWNGSAGGGSGLKGQAPEDLKKEYLEFCERERKITRQILKETIQQRPVKDEAEKKDQQLANLETEKAAWDKKIEQYDVPDGYRTWYHWMKKQLGILDDDDHFTSNSLKATNASL